MQLLAPGVLARDVDKRSFVVAPALRLALDTLNRGVARGLRHDLLGELVPQGGETCNVTTLGAAVIGGLTRMTRNAIVRVARVRAECDVIMKHGH